MTKKSPLQVPTLAIHTHLAFAHRLKQGRLGARRSAVDFIREQDVGKDRSLVKVELLVALAEDRYAEEVRRQQIGPELDALELRVYRTRQGFGQRRLARARKILQQDVAAAGKRGQQLARRGRLTLHNPGDVGRNLLVNRARGLMARLRHLSI